MNIKRFAIASVVLFILWQITGYIIHEVILGSTYEALKSVFRPDMNEKMWMFMPMQAVVTLLFVYIFIKGYENKGLMEGVRYGIIIALFMGIPSSFSQYVLYPFPFSLALQWFLYGVVEYILAGILVSVIYKPKAKTQTQKV
jgi:hypothetical protein